MVTGGAAGIGKAVAQLFVAEGASVAVIDRDPGGAPAGTTPLQADVTSDAEVNAAIASFGTRHGHIDVLVANAGVSYTATVEDGPLHDWQRILDINVLGYVRATRAALPFLRRSQHAAIVNMSSCTAATGLRRRVLYSATKGAIEAMTRAIAADLLHEGIRVNCVSPDPRAVHRRVGAHLRRRAGPAEALRFMRTTGHDARADSRSRTASRTIHITNGALHESHQIQAAAGSDPDGRRHRRHGADQAQVGACDLMQGLIRAIFGLRARLEAAPVKGLRGKRTNLHEKYDHPSLHKRSRHHP